MPVSYLIPLSFCISNCSQFGAKICLLTSFRDTCLIEIVPRDLTPTKELWLSFWCEVHYNSLYAIDDLLTRKAKKKHWLF
uniref:Uncharacterized protein n=1 Tax=Arundo donax TaxID=35708 RepID=A0A0A9DMH8_ARUDO